VRDAELHGDQHRRSERRHLGTAAAPAGKRDRDRQTGGGPLDQMLLEAESSP